MPEKGREAIEGVIIIINLRKTLAAVVLVIGGFLSFQTALGPGLAAELRVRRPPQNEAIERFRRDQAIDELPPDVRDKMRRALEVRPREGFEPDDCPDQCLCGTPIPPQCYEPLKRELSRGLEWHQP